MNTLMNAEKLIVQSFLSNDVTVHLVCDLFLFHFKAVDSVENTHHSQAIELLYKSKNKNYTKQRIADELFSSIKLLKHDREQYTKYFNYFYCYLQNRSFSAEAAIAFLC